MLTILLIAMVIGAIPAAIASSKGQNFFLWYVYGVLLFIVALIHSLVLPPVMQQVQDQRALQMGELRRCPACAELVRRQAVVCRFCGRDLPPLTASDAPAARQPAVRSPAETQKENNRLLIGFGVFVVVAGLLVLAVSSTSNSPPAPLTNPVASTPDPGAPAVIFSRYCPAVLVVAQRQYFELTHYVQTRGEARRAGGSLQCGAIRRHRVVWISFLVTCGNATTDCVSVTDAQPRP